MGNDATGRNVRRADGDGDLARSSGAVLGQERERETGWGIEMNGYGGVRTPHIPLLTPTCSRGHGSTAGHRGSTARAEVPLAAW